MAARQEDETNPGAARLAPTSPEEKFVSTKFPGLVGTNRALVENAEILIDEALTDSRSGHSVDLELVNHRLLSLPAIIGEIDNLRSLWCFNNSLTVIPAAIGNCRNLDRFGCFSNKLTELPDLSRCSKLRVLYCAFNDLKVLPEWVWQANLDDFTGIENPWDPDWLEAFSAGNDITLETLKAYKERKSGHTIKPARE